MIDLHIHSKYSIGEYSPNEIIDIALEKKLEVFSITDNNHCLAYKDFNMQDYENLISGVIYTTSIEGLIINIIGYEVNPDIINSKYYDYHSKDKIEKTEYKIFDKLISIMNDNDIKLSDNIQLTLVESGVSKKLIYYDAVKNNEDFPFRTYSDFYRNGLSNPYSDFFLNEGEGLLSIKEVIDIIKEAGGLVFLAHPYEYGVKVDDLIEKLLDYGIDGIEVFHSSAAIRQSLKLLKICEHNGLNASAGSDFRKSRYNIPIGINLHHNTDDLKCFKWMNKYLEEQ